jgi:AcrR family transcriptional regulator
MLATLSLLDEGHSYADLTVERIAEAAGRTRTAFYFYFRDKRELLMRLTEQVAEQPFKEADRWWSGERGQADLEQALPRPPLAAAPRVCGKYLGCLSTYDEEVGGFWRAVIGRFIDATQSRLVAEGESERGAAQAKAFVLVWGTERACYQQLARGGSLDDGELIGALVEVWERAVYPTQSKRRPKSAPA